MRTPLFLAKFSRYEYWPFWLFYLPVLPYWLYLSIKNKSFAFFTAANPAIELGGFYGESKTEILSMIHSRYLPISLTVSNTIKIEIVLENFKSTLQNFPVVAKPDVGERGTKVTVIKCIDDLKKYHTESSSKYIIQEFIDYKIELGILYSRMPDSNTGKVSSITLKEFLSVTGDGKSTIKQLMQKNLRSRFQIKRLNKQLGEKMETILENGKVQILEPIGNHCRGTKFIDNNFLINEELNRVFDKICLPIKGFYYGRFDLKVKDIESLYQGENIKIMELNGASSEPGHIYEPSSTLLKAYKDLMYHWKLLALISAKNIKDGVKPASFTLIARSYLKNVLLKN